ncbi:MAG: transketolase C-terminal domain-containing protein, partial [Cyclobacteriaceae bacterium]
LYRSLKGEVTNDYFSIPIGSGNMVQEGNDLSIITYGMGVHWATEIAEKIGDISIEIIDLRSISPWDQALVRLSVEKNGKVIVLTEDCSTGGISAEIAAWISEHCFSYLDAPVQRVASLDTPVPFNKELEGNFLAKKRLEDTIHELNAF